MILHQSDCLPILRAMKTKSVDLIVTDPPYGIGFADQSPTSGLGRGAQKTWDNSLPSRAIFREMLRVGRRHIIWGGNYFAHMLPPSNGWLVWYKMGNLPPLQFSSCELAWTSCDTKPLVFSCRHRGFLKDSKEALVEHPTQKALEVMKWCIELFSKPGDTILDPFLGSGTTAVACVLLKRKFIGVEREAEYMQIARRRVALAHSGIL